MDFLKEIECVVALGNIDPTGGFLGKVKPTETVVGICSRYSMILLTFKKELMEARDDWEATIKATDEVRDKKNYLDYRAKIWLLNQKIDALSSHVNLDLHEGRPELLMKDLVTVREGWQIVWSESEKEPDILPLLIDVVKTLSRPKGSCLAGKN